MMVMDYLMMVMDWTEENIETDLSLTSLQLTCSSSHCSVTSLSKLVSKILSLRSLKRVSFWRRQCPGQYFSWTEDWMGLINDVMM